MKRPDPVTSAIGPTASYVLMALKRHSVPATIQEVRSTLGIAWGLNPSEKRMRAAFAELVSKGGACASRGADGLERWAVA